MAALSASPSANLLTLQADGESGLLRTFALHPELCTPAALARVREQLALIINAVIEQDPDHNIGRTIAQILRGFRLGFSAIMESRQRQGKNSDEGVVEYIRERKIDRVYATGNKIWVDQVQNPLADVVKANQLPREFGDLAVLSKIVYRCMLESHIQDPENFASEDFRRIAAGDVRSMQEVRGFTAELDTLRHILGLAKKIGIDQPTLRRALEPGIESGLRNLADLGDENFLGYLEIGVFAKAYSTRYAMPGVTPLTFPAEEAQAFFRDFEKNSAKLKPEAFAGSQDACDVAFDPEDRELAKKITRAALAAIQECMHMHMFVVRDCPSPEYFFPVHQFSPELLTGKPARRRKKS